MSICRMTRITVAADFYNVLIPFILEICIGHSNSYVPAVIKEIITVLSGDYSFIQRHMLPYVFC